ncbi:hypothetical protein [Corynebacterium ulceribovis]|uniref:hypothetical protein n=1 Tax=Corynebacterium ulceribovis TaxID=487732 RepID=UPI00036018D2|nr:hypothetical protein [Corynebacterium ulceribovis]
MYAVYARYRGPGRRRAELVSASAAALSGMAGCENIRVVDVDSIVGTMDSPISTTALLMALISAKHWAIGISVANPASMPDAESLEAAAKEQLTGVPRAGSIRAAVLGARPDAQSRAKDIMAVFALLQHVLARRSPQGREATALMRDGWSQIEAAAELGITKQAMSQRLAAAGWHAEEAGWRLAVNVLERAAG